MNRRARSRRLLQLVVGALSLVPIFGGAAGVLTGPGFVGANDASTDVDSHFRYLSGIFLGLGFAFLWTVPAIERRTLIFRLLGALVVAGGLARLLSLLLVGQPSLPHLAGLGLELLVVPLLVLWQSRLASEP